MVLMKIRNPYCSANIWSSGKVTVTGTTRCVFRKKRELFRSNSLARYLPVMMMQNVEHDVLLDVYNGSGSKLNFEIIVLLIVLQHVQCHGQLILKNYVIHIAIMSGRIIIFSESIR
jgi:TATA-box binding protein (TBP) (component of TFIID and TFIIIB)